MSLRKETNRIGKMKNNAPVKQAVPYTHLYKVSRSDTLLEFLLKKMDLSRNSVKSLLASHKVLVNGNMVSQFDYPLAKDDEVKIARTAQKATVQPKLKKHVQSPVKKMIIYEDEEFLAFNKPAGLLSVESDKETECAYRMAADYLREKGAKSRPYILHRIDKETSGVLVFAKDIKLHSMMRMNWNSLVTLREYVAVVRGHLEEKSGTIVSYLKENQNNLVYVSKDRNGKKAITHYEVLEESRDYSLLRVKIDTGRKNQIRVQLADKGHPIVGDDKYSDGEGPLKRLGLHASALEFRHPLTKETVSLRAPIPQSFRNLFKKTK